MTSTNEREMFFETKDIVLGRLERSQLAQDFSVWSMSNLSVSTLNLKLFKNDTHIPNGRELLVFLADNKELKKLPIHPHLPSYHHIQTRIAKAYRFLALKHRENFWWKISDLHVLFYDFLKEARIETVSRAAWDIRQQILEHYPMVWDAQPWGDGFVVFYPTDDDVTLHEYRGLSKKIAETYYSILEKYDDLDCFTQQNISLRFDSKMNLKSKARGSMYYYY